MHSGQILAYPLNYNKATEEMIFVKEGKKFAIANPHDVAEVEIEKRVFVPWEGVFFERLSSGQISLYAQYQSEVEAEGIDIGYGAKATDTGSQDLTNLIQEGQINELKLPEKYRVINRTSFWIENDNQREKVNSKNQYLKIFPKHKSELKSYIKEHDPDFKSTGDLMQLVAFTSGLQ